MDRDCSRVIFIVSAGRPYVQVNDVILGGYRYIFDGGYLDLHT